MFRPMIVGTSFLQLENAELVCSSRHPMPVRKPLEFREEGFRVEDLKLDTTFAIYGMSKVEPPIMHFLTLMTCEMEWIHWFLERPGARQNMLNCRCEAVLWAMAMPLNLPIFRRPQGLKLSCSMVLGEREYTARPPF